jgi:hypothetical protein
MKHKILAMLMVAGAALLPVSSHAALTEDSFQARTTGDLLDMCSASPKDPLGHAAFHFCEGFGIGVFRVLQKVDAARKMRMFCMSDPMPTRSEALTAFIAWGKANPGQLDQAPEDGVAAFLSSQYPCPRKK